MLGRVIRLCLSERNTMEVFQKMASITEQMTCLRETLLKMQKQFKQLENTVKSFRPEQKWCPQCKRYLEFGMFYKNRTRPDGLCGVCKECDNRNRMARGYYR